MARYKIISTPHKTGGIAYTKGANRPADKVQYQKGGKAPIYTSDARKIRPYQDSLELYKWQDRYDTYRRSLDEQGLIDGGDNPEYWMNQNQADAFYRLQNAGKATYPDHERGHFKKPVQPYIYRSEQLSISQPNQLPTGTGYTPQQIQNPYITESTDWYSPEVQGDRYVPAGFRTTSKMPMPEYQKGGKVKKPVVVSNDDVPTDGIAVDPNPRMYLSGPQMRINDPRKVRATTQQPINPNVDLLAGNYSQRAIGDIALAARKQGVDPYTLEAIALHESGFGKINDDLGRAGRTTNTSYAEGAANIYAQKVQDAKRLGITNEVDQVQLYNGTGKIPYMEGVKKIYGVPLPKEGIDMKQNPLYGKQIIDIRDNVLRKNPKFTHYVDSVYSSVPPQKKDGGKIDYTSTANKPASKVQYQKGGKVNKPIYVDSPNDPRIQPYQDSLSLYQNAIDRFYNDVPKEKRNRYFDRPYVGASTKIEDRGTNNGKKVVEIINSRDPHENDKIKPVQQRMLKDQYENIPLSTNTITTKGEDFYEGSNIYDIYKQPVQPYIYQPNHTPGNFNVYGTIDGQDVRENFHTKAAADSFIATRKMKKGGPIGYTNMSTRAQPTTTQMPTSQPQYSTGEQWYIDHPQQYMNQGQQQGTPQQQRDHEYLRNKMYQQEAEERANREFAQKMTPGSELAEKFMNAEMLMSGTGMVGKGLRGISKKVAKKMADDIMPYSGNFPAAYTKGAKGNTPMPTITEVPPLSAEDKVYQSFGIQPRDVDRNVINVGNDILETNKSKQLFPGIGTLKNEELLFPKGEPTYDPDFFPFNQTGPLRHYDTPDKVMKRASNFPEKGMPKALIPNKLQQNKYGGSIQYQQGGSVTNNNTMKKRYKILSTPEYATGGGFRFDQNANPSTQAYQQWQMVNKPVSVGRVTQAFGQPAGGYDDGNYGFRTKMAGSMTEPTTRQVQTQQYRRKMVADPVTGVGRIQQVPVDEQEWNQYASGAPTNNAQSYSYGQQPQMPAVNPIATAYTPPTQSLQQPWAMGNKSNMYDGANEGYGLDAIRQGMDYNSCNGPGCYEYAYGGQTPADSSGVRRTLSTPWMGSLYATKGLPDNYEVKNTIPEAEEGEEDIVVEKEEIILQPTPSGMYAQKAGAGSHAEGKDKPIQVPDGTFVISDTSDLKIKDKDIQKEFNMPFKKSGYTPAKLGGKYVADLNKFTTMVNNPQTDNITRDTAQKMVANITRKLGKLSEYQEGMKQEMGIPQPGQGMRYGGTPEMQGGGSDKLQTDGTPMVAVYNPQTGQMDYVPDTQTTGDYSYPEYTVTAKRPQTYTGQYSPIKELPVHQRSLILQPTNTQANMQNVVPQKGATIGDMQADTPVVDKKGEKKKEEQQNYRTSGFTTPDRLAMANSMLNYANLHKYNPWEPPVTGTIPRAVYMDPGRALAANSEQAGMVYRGLQNRGNNLANFLGIQGQAGKQAADILGQYSNANVQIANQANQQASQIQNALLEAQRNRLKSLHQGNTIAAQQYDNAEREARADLMSVYQNAWKNEQMMDDLNQTNQFYGRDFNKGKMHFKSGEAKAKFIAETYGRNKGLEGEGTLDNYTKIWKQAYDAAPEGADKTKYANDYIDYLKDNKKKKEFGGTVTTKKKSPNMLEYLRNARGL